MEADVRLIAEDKKGSHAMMSEGARLIERLYKEWAVRLQADPPMDLAGTRDMFEGWHLFATEPEDVSYAEQDVEGIAALWCNPAGATADRVMLYFHGGGYVVGSMHSHRKYAGHLAKAIGCRALVLDYRRAPEHLHPAQLDDGLTAYRWLLAQGIAADRIVLAGDSAGGGLATGVALALHDAGDPLPAAVLAASPLYDMEAVGETLVTRADVDVLFLKPVLEAMVGMFLGEGSRQDPRANALHADLADMPPIMIVTGDYEMLLDDSVRFERKAKAAGVDVVLQVVPEMQHVFVLGAGRADEADRAIADMAAWTRSRLGLHA